MVIGDLYIRNKDKLVYKFIGVMTSGVKRNVFERVDAPGTYESCARPWTTAEFTKYNENGPVAKQEESRSEVKPQREINQLHTTTRSLDYYMQQCEFNEAHKIGKVAPRAELPVSETFPYGLCEW